MKKKVKGITLELFKILCAAMIVLPVIIAVVVSFQSEREVLSIPYKLSIANPTFDNYIYALKNMNLLQYGKNTFVQIAICLPAQMITALLAAYAFAYFEFPCKNLLFSLLLASMMIPGETVLMTQFKMIAKWNMVNTYAGLTIMFLTNVSALFMFRQCMLSLPKSLWEAARIDGCGRMRYFFKVLAPLCKSLVVAQAMTSFIGLYGNYMWPLLIMTVNDMRTLQTAIAYFQTASHPGLMFAAVIITLIIPVTMFVFGLDYIMEGMTAGAVKD